MVALGNGDAEVCKASASFFMVRTFFRTPILYTPLEQLMGKLRFLVSPVILSLVFAYFMPLSGMTLPVGFAGFVAAVALGVTFSLAFTGHRLLEHWAVRRFTRNAVEAYFACQFTALLGVVLTGLTLYGVNALLPQYVQIPNWSAAALGGFWLAVIGLNLAPSPALTASYRAKSPNQTPDAEKGDGTEPPA